MVGQGWIGDHPLSVVTFLPLVCAPAILIMRNPDPKIVAANARKAALLVSVFTFGFSFLLWAMFDRVTDGFRFVEDPWMEKLGFSIQLGIDRDSILYLLLATFLFPIFILACSKVIKRRTKELMAGSLVLETLLLGAICRTQAG